MSLREMPDSFHKVVCHLRTGGKVADGLCGYFKGYKKITEGYAHQIAKLNENFAVPGEGTLYIALHAYKDFIGKHVQEVVEFATHIQLDVIEPLELFTKQFVLKTNSGINDEAVSARKLKKAKDNLRKSRNKYYSACANIEKLEKNLKDENERKEKSLKHAAETVYSTEELYKNSIGLLNNHRDTYEAQVPKIMDELQKVEEQRIVFIKSSLKKLGKHHLQYGSQLREIVENVTGIFENINSHIDIAEFVDTNKKPSHPHVREEFTTYEEWKNRNFAEPKESIPTSVASEDNAIQDAESQFISNILDFLIPSTTSEELNLIPTAMYDEDYGKLAEIVHTVEGQRAFIDSLETKSYQLPIPLDNMIQIAAVIKIMLSTMITENTQDPHLFYKLVFIAHKFYTEDNEKLKFLSYYLATHSIWQDQQQWLNAIIYVFEFKLRSDRENRRRRFKRANNGLFKSIKNAFAKESTTVHYEKPAFYLIASQFIFHMIHLQVPLSLANLIILISAKRVKLDSERTCNLLAELQANYDPQKWEDYLFPRHKATQSKWGSLLPIRYSLEYLNQLELLTVLQVSKTWNSLFKRLIVKKLVFTNYMKFRDWSWRILLEPDRVHLEYPGPFEEDILSNEISKESSELIEMDVARSFQNNPAVNPQVLSRILRAFAYFNPKIGYCQGINYIAGTLYLQFQDTGLTIRSLQSMLGNYNMEPLFEEGLPKLKQCFFQLDKLIGIFLPEVHSKFRDLGISSSHFAPPWFITIFASTLQGNLPLLLRIWDLFLLKGWKIVFQAAVLILKINSETFLSSEFDGIMFLISSISSKNYVFQESFIEDLQDIPISNFLLEQLEGEYEQLKRLSVNF